MQFNIVHTGQGILIAGQICIQKKSVMDQATTAAKLDIDDDTNQIDTEKMELGFAVKSEIDMVQKENQYIHFRSTVSRWSAEHCLNNSQPAKLLERCLLKYLIGRQLVTLDHTHHQRMHVKKNDVINIAFCRPVL